MFLSALNEYFIFPESTNDLEGFGMGFIFGAGVLLVYCTTVQYTVNRATWLNALFIALLPVSLFFFSS